MARAETTRKGILLALTVLAALLFGSSTYAQTPQTVPAEWRYVPDGIGAGESFRLLFVSHDGVQARDGDIATYNSNIQQWAAQNPDTYLSGFSSEFRALISTASIDARDNTATAPDGGGAYSDGEGVPIYWLGGDKISDHYKGFYDEVWLSHEVKNHLGDDHKENKIDGREINVWTGSISNGTKKAGKTAGSSSVQHGLLRGEATSRKWQIYYDRREGHNSSGYLYLYALSPVLTVSEEDDTPPEIRLIFDTTPTVGEELVEGIRILDESNVAKYGVAEVSGYETDGTACDDPVEDGFFTESVSFKDKYLSYTPSSTGAGSRICVYAEDEHGNSNSSINNCLTYNGILPSIAVPHRPTSYVVLEGWKYIPEGISPGQEFRLMFSTSSQIRAESPDIDAYNVHVRNAANNNVELRPYSHDFRALISTPTVAARDNTATSYTNGNLGVPIYWVEGKQVANEYREFYTRNWRETKPDDYGTYPHLSKNEKGSGGISGNDFYWTGSNNDGTRHTSNHAGQCSVKTGRLSGQGRLEGLDGIEFISGRVNVVGRINVDSILGLSPVFVVDNPTETPRPTGLRKVSNAKDTEITIEWDQPSEKVETFQYRYHKVDGRKSGLAGEHTYCNRPESKRSDSNGWTDWTTRDWSFSLNIPGLEPEVMYCLQLRSCGEKGVGGKCIRPSSPYVYDEDRTRSDTGNLLTECPSGDPNCSIQCTGKCPIVYLKSRTCQSLTLHLEIQGAITYKVQWKRPSDASWGNSAYPDQNSYTIEGLSQNTEYEVKITGSSGSDFYGSGWREVGSHTKTFITNMCSGTSR